MTKDKSRIQSCIDHINTAVDVDPWAKELVAEMGKEILKAQLSCEGTTSDCISRQAVRFIETNSDSYPEEWNDDYEKGFTDALNKVIALPSVQPEPCSDAISRQAAIDALGGNEPVGDPSKMDDDDVVKMWERIRIINIINKLPSVQPEIIHCKDCKDYHKIPTGEVWTCRYFRRAVMSNDFCSRAERRTDETD